MYTYIPMITIKNELISKINDKTNVIQEVVSSEVSKPNHAVRNKRQGDQIQFFLEKKLAAIIHKIFETNFSFHVK